MNIKFSFTTLISVITISASICTAQLAYSEDTVTEVERRNLIAIARQLEQLHQLADAAQSAADPDARVKFNYTQLHRDLEQMQGAITRHLDRPSRTPRSIPPPTGDYGQ